MSITMNDEDDYYSFFNWFVKGLAYVDFSDDAHLAAAVEKNKQMLLGKRVSIARSNPNRNKKDNSHSDGQREHGRLMDLYHSLLHVFALGHACVCGHIILCQFHLLIKCCVCVWQCCTFVLISFVSPNCCSP